MPSVPTVSSADLIDRFHALQARLRTVEAQYQRPEGSVALLAVSKTQPIAAMAALAAAGQQAFGENYVQEAVEKIRALASWGLEWHMIGPVQSNKTRVVAEHCAWVHTVDRLSIAQRLSQQRPAHLPPLQLCLQVNIDAEPTKHGVSETGLLPLAMAVADLPHVCLRGLMAIPAPARDLSTQRAIFARLRACATQLQAAGLSVDTLSMGMSDDLEAAIAEGSTLVRVGTALFGTRTPIRQH